MIWRENYAAIYSKLDEQNDDELDCQIDNRLNPQKRVSPAGGYGFYQVSIMVSQARGHNLPYKQWRLHGPLDFLQHAISSINSRKYHQWK